MSHLAGGGEKQLAAAVHHLEVPVVGDVGGVGLGGGGHRVAAAPQLDGAVGTCELEGPRGGNAQLGGRGAGDGSRGAPDLRQQQQCPGGGRRFGIGEGGGSCCSPRPS
jgi:hypothetical protein